MQKRFDAIMADLLRSLSGEVSGCRTADSDDGRPRGHSLLVAVSGGVDSMTLAHLCLHSGLRLSSGPGSQSEPGFRMTVAHCNFHLRGEESDGDEALVREWCAKNGVEVHVADFDTLAYAGEHGLSIEMAARELRYGWFASLCRERGFSAVAVAHNANDNAETLILNLLRGTGLRGLCGMKPLSCVPEGMSSSKTERVAGPNDDKSSNASLTDPESGIPLLRPLLSFTRDQILGYARANGISWREDSTNADSDCKRNLLRNEVFPLLAKINPSFIETVNREMRHFSSAADIVEHNCPKLIRNGRLDIHDLLGYEHWPYLLYILLEPYGFDGATVSSIETLLRAAFLDGEHPAKDITMSGKTFHAARYTLHTTSKELVITEKAAHNFSSEVTVTQQGEYSVDNIEFNVEMLDREQIASLKASKGTLYLDAEAMPFPFVVRHWNHGDWIMPFGMGGRRKKISDLFVDLKYDYIKKNNALFIERFEDACNRNDTDGAHVYALLGERIDDAVKVTPATTKVLKITLI